MLSDAELQRFFAKVGPLNERGCREWTASTAKGYGKIRIGGKLQAAHRVAFYIANGYWPKICRHTCDNPPCCEPTHLLDGSKSANTQDCVDRGRHYQASKTHCPAGHEYTDENTYRWRGFRKCRACQRAREQERKK